MFVTLLVIDNGLQMAVSGLAAHFLLIETVDGLGMCDFFPAGCALECCAVCDGLEMVLCERGQWHCDVRCCNICGLGV